MSTLPIVTLSFPEIALRVRDAHKVRGYFGQLFKDKSPLLHNHFEADSDTSKNSLRYAYPLVQYKVLKQVPHLVGIEEGARLLATLFQDIQEIVIEDQTYPVNRKQFDLTMAPIGFSPNWHTYRFETLWLPLNSKNYDLYRTALPPNQVLLLERMAIGNVLSLFKSFGIFLQPHEKLSVRLDLTPARPTQFKGNAMLGFKGKMYINAQLPNGIGIGKSVARGFGTLKCIDIF